jgi:DNA-binding NtrC family response regulator
MGNSAAVLRLADRDAFAEVIVVDEDQGVLEYVGEILDRNRAAGHFFSQSADLLEHLAEGARADLILLDSQVGGQGSCEPALELLAKVRKLRPLAPVVMLACSGDPQEAIRAYQMGAVNFILKPFGKADIDKVLSEYAPARDESQTETKEIPLDEETSFVRASRRMREVEGHCRLVASTDLPVLILGESGTGKEIAAKFIHSISQHSRRNFLKVNCAAMPLDLLESELFGYEQGAFTGAMKSKPGKFEQCDNGTIFLDEIGEMPTALQAKLLQVLQDGTFSRLGSRVTMKVNVRVIAATNINMKAAIAAKTFREDLYYRLNGFSIHLPPLRERREEIPVLAKYFMCRNASKLQRDPQPLSATMLLAFNNYAWPGNIRELENTVKRHLVLADEQAIISELHPGLRAWTTDSSSDANGCMGGLKHLVRGVKGDAESVLIARTLETTRWNRKAAAATLQISYKALLYKIKQYQLTQSEAV